MNSNVLVCQTIRAICNLSMRHFKPIDKSITHMQGAFIGYIHSFGEKDIFQRDIEKEFNIRRSTATGILNLMEEKKLIIRQPVERDKRLKKIVLTEKAIAFNNEILDNICEIENILKKDITKEELAVFFTVTEKMIKNLKQINAGGNA